MSKKIDLAKQAQALERLKAEFERLNRQFDELKAASGVASDDELVVDESKLPPEVRTAFLEMKAQAEKKYNYQLRFYDSGPMAIEDLLNGRIDAIGLDAAPAEDAIRKDDAETMKLVNEGYKLLKADPYWKELQAKYLGNK